MPQEYDYLAIVDERAPTAGGYTYNLASPSSPIKLDSKRPWQLTLAPERYLAMGSYDSQDPIVEEIPVIIQGASQDITETHKLRIANMLGFFATRYAKGMQQTPIKLQLRAKGSTTVYECLILGQATEDDPATVIDPDYGYMVPNNYIVPNVTLKFKRRGPIVASPVDYALTNLINAPDIQYVAVPDNTITSPYTLRVGSFNATNMTAVPDLTLLAARGRGYLQHMPFTGANSGSVDLLPDAGRTAFHTNLLTTSVASSNTSKVLLSLATDVRRVRVYAVMRATVATDVWSVVARFYGLASTSAQAVYPAFSTIGGEDFSPSTMSPSAGTNPRVVYLGTGGFPDSAPQAMDLLINRISGSGSIWIDQVLIIAADNDTSTVLQTKSLPSYTNAWGTGAPSQIAYYVVRYDPRSSYRPVVRLENNTTTTPPIYLTPYGVPMLRSVGTEIAFTLLGPDTAYVLTTNNAQTGAAMQLDGIATRYTRSLYPL